MKPKFRLFDKATKAMIYGVGITPTDDSMPFIISKDKYKQDIDDIVFYPDGVLMQWTGIKIKFGANIFEELYEGDICRKPNGNIGVIKYLTDRDNFAVGFFLCDESGHVMKIEPCQRIGNIHENKELLNTSNSGAR